MVMVDDVTSTRHPDNEVIAAATFDAADYDLDVEQKRVVSLLPQQFHWIEVEAEYLGPARPRIPRHLVGMDE
jgi:hypothetical protein